MTVATAALLAIGWLVVNAPSAEEARRQELIEVNPRATTVDASSSLVFGLRWRQPIVRTGAHRQVIGSFGRPAVSVRHNLVIFGQGEGEVRAVRVEDGKTAWVHDYGAPFETTVTLIPPSGGRPEIALVTARDGVILALASGSGERLWTADVEADVRAPINRVKDALLVTTVANRVNKLSLVDGKRLWNEGRPAPTSLTVEGHSAATHHDGVVYAAFADGYVEAFSFADGAKIWSRPLSFSGAEFIDADADPIVADGQLHVASYSDGVFALDLEQGQTIWHRPAPSVTSLAAYDDEASALIIAGSADGFLWALERSTGDMVYRTRMPPGNASRLHVRDRLAVMTAGDNGLLVFDARSGRPLQATAVAGNLASDPTWDGDYVAAIADSGWLYLFSLGDPGMVR